MKTKQTNRWYFRSGLQAGLFLCGVAVTLLCSCSKDEPGGKDDDQPGIVEFRASTDANGITTRTTGGGDLWVSGDRVGIYMVHAGSPAISGNILTVGGTSADNIAYDVAPGTPASNASFSPAPGESAIYYPQDGSAVDFIAYYPYTGRAGNSAEEISDYTYHISVTDQSDPAKIDLMYARTNNVVKSKSPVNLPFRHVLSKITWNVKARTGFAGEETFPITQIKIEGVPVEAKLNLQDGSLTNDPTPGYFAIPEDKKSAVEAEASYSAILLPQPTGGTDRHVLFYAGNEIFVWSMPDTDTFEEGNHYTYSVTVNKTGVSVDPPTITPWLVNDNTDGSGEASTGALPLEMVLIKKGTFLMGSPENEPNHRSNETLHEVRLTKSFYMGKYPVTNSEYAAYLNAKRIQGEELFNPSWNSLMTSGTCTWGRYEGEHLIYDGGGNYPWGIRWDEAERRWLAQTGYERHPVIWVTWFGAYEYAVWLTETTGMKCRLPTEAEWEYACRGGQSESLPFGIGDGRKLDGDRANINGRFAYDYDNGGEQEYNALGTFLGGTSPVGSYPYPNGFGLYDMHGNVFEWCSDWYDAYDIHSVVDPTGPSSGDFRVLRGGSWDGFAQNCRSAYRNGARPAHANNAYGFRVVFVP